MANGARHPVTPNLIQPHNASSNGICSHTRHHPATVGRMPGLCEPGDAQDDGEQIRRNPAGPGTFAGVGSDLCPRSGLRTFVLPAGPEAAAKVEPYRTGRGVWGLMLAAPAPPPRRHRAARAAAALP